MSVVPEAEAGLLYTPYLYLSGHIHTLLSDRLKDTDFYLGILVCIKKYTFYE